MHGTIHHPSIHRFIQESQISVLPITRDPGHGFSAAATKLANIRLELNSMVQIVLPIRPHIVSSMDSHKESTTSDSPGMKVIHYLKSSISNLHVSSRYMNRSMNKEEKIPSEREEVDESEEDIKVTTTSSSNSSSLRHQNYINNSDTNFQPNVKRSDKSSKLGTQYGIEGKEDQQQSRWAIGKSVVEVSRTLFHMKDILIEKVASARPSLSTDTLEHARRSIESMIVEASQSAYGRTRDIMLRIRLLLVEHIPSLSPQESKKIVDDVEREILDSSLNQASNGNTNPTEKMMDGSNTEVITGRSSTASATTNPRFPQLSMFATNMDRIKSWPLFRSRL